MTRTEARNWRRKIEQAAGHMPDEEALEAVDLFPSWKVDTAYEVQTRVRYEGRLYRCEQAHTSQAAWTPDATPALWTEVAAPGEIPVWRQPIGAQDAYMTGDKVWYPDKEGDIYVSTVDYNTWIPGEYGWEVVE